MNRTVRERLDALPALRREITRTKRRLAELEKSRDGENDLTFVSTKAQLERYLADALAEQELLLSYINDIYDGGVREIFMLRFYDGVRPWQKVAFLAGEHDESFVRRKVQDYIQRHKVL